MKNVRLARDLGFPAAELSTLVVALLGNRGSGKSNAAFVIIEGLLAASIPVIVIDYVGIYWSLRLDDTGKHPSPFQIPVLGGAHGDIPLMPSTGSVVADALARSQSSAVLDVSLMSKGDRCRFATDFAETFFRVKKDHPGPVQIWLEESQRFIPQKLFTGQERMLGAFEEIAEVGRNYGIGLGLISQRPQKINKDVLNLADVLIALRMNGVLERKAIAEWVQEKEAIGRDAVKDELPGLARGNAIVWSPSVFNTYGTYQLHKRATYDVNATPLAVRKAVKIKALDLAELETVMGTAVEEAKANDPRILRARIAELERGLALAKQTGAPTKTIEREVLSEKSIKRLEKLVDKLAQAQQAVLSELGNVRTVLGKSAKQAMMDGVAAGVAAAKHGRFENGSPPRDGDPQLSRCARALLGVLAQRGVASDSQLSALSGYRKTSSGFANALSELRTKRLIDDGSPDRRGITQAGRELAGPVEPLPRGAELLGYWRRRLSKAEATILACVYGHGTVDRETIASETDYSITSSGFANAISGLRTLDLVYGPNGGDLTIADVFKE